MQPKKNLTGLVLLHSLAKRTDHDFLRDESPQFWHCLFLFRQCRMLFKKNVKLNQKVTGTY